MTVACASEQKASVDDASGPAVECTTDCEKPCCTSECSGENAAECSSEETKVCPVTGKAIN